MPDEPDTTVDSPPQEGESSSSTLLHLVQAQAPLAWQRLVDLYAPLIYRWCRRRNLQADDAADVAQEVFAAVFAKVGEFRKDRPGDTFRGWVVDGCTEQDPRPLSPLRGPSSGVRWH